MWWKKFNNSKLAAVSFEVNALFLVGVDFIYLFVFLFSTEAGCEGENATCCIGLRQSHTEALVRRMIVSAAEAGSYESIISSLDWYGIHLTLRKPTVFTHSIKPHAGSLPVDT